VSPHPTLVIVSGPAGSGKTTLAHAIASAEAAFQDHVWRPRLEPLVGLARLRVVHCTVAADLALRRVQQRGRDNPLRRAHTDFAALPSERAFVRVAMDAPSRRSTLPTATGPASTRSSPSSTAQPAPRDGTDGA
jgi:hypothetical protein